MGFSLNKIAKVGSLGLIKDFTGEEAAAASARAGQTSAMQAEREMFDKSMARQEEMWKYQKEQMAPWQQAGLQGLQGYQNLLQDPSSITQDPGYQFRMQQGLGGIESGAAARGMGLSGATLKGLTRFGQDYASNEYGTALNRQMGLANYGMQANQALMGGAQQYGTSTGNLFMNQGQNLSNYYSNMGQINAAQATSGFNSLMQLGNLGLAAYTGGASMMAGGGGPLPSGGGGGGAGFLQPVQSNIRYGL